MPLHTPARSEQPQSQILKIARKGVRSAAMAPSDSEALDAAGGALAHIAAIACANRLDATLDRSVTADLRSTARATTALQRVHFLLVLAESALQPGAIDQQNATALLKNAMTICRLNGEGQQRNATSEVHHGQ